MVSAKRCAIYTRKSHEERADAQLGSIERQRELCQAYIASQAGEGWHQLDGEFDDPGQSGGSLDRPALTRLLAAVDVGKVDVIVVYKIDRLSRSLRDFVNLVERFDRSSVTFVSVTQHFSTTTSMGRLTLNILLSFAQFERELAGERSRDWKAGARARGLWTSGRPPYGYRANALRLEIDDEQAKVVRLVYRLFVSSRSFTNVAVRLNAAGHRNRQGRVFDGRTIKAMVARRLYRGELPHGDEWLAGTHRPIVTERQWRQAQQVLEQMGAKPHRW